MKQLSLVFSKNLYSPNALPAHVSVVDWRSQPNSGMADPSSFNQVLIIHKTAGPHWFLCERSYFHKIPSNAFKVGDFGDSWEAAKYYYYRFFPLHPPIPLRVFGQNDSPLRGEGGTTQFRYKGGILGPKTLFFLTGLFLFVLSYGLFCPFLTIFNAKTSFLSLLGYFFWRSLAVFPLRGRWVPPYPLRIFWQNDFRDRGGGGTPLAKKIP